MDCEHIQHQLHARRPLDPAAARHLSECAACAALAAVAPLLPGPEAGGPAAVDRELLASALAELERERGGMAWLRERSRGARLALAIMAAVVVPLVVVVAAPRADLPAYPRVRLLLELGVLAAVFGGAAAITLWPMQRPLTPSRRRGVVALALVAVAALASLPAAHEHVHASAAPFVVHALGCLAFGTACALPTWLALRLLARERGSFGARAPVLAAAALAVGTIAVLLHCPILATAHLWCGHVAIVVPLAAWAWWNARTPLR